ncbi:glycoside hydrolase family 15 protein [Vulgatibacter incomptus]|uniref:Glucoamylase n=1 Tax=Vulgatibacter incomptus TaxID=1391653 RepID=A0A0K1P9M9_9BACT|nr:glycoside hydrolase family 15 protein [Vulgatibacter incomptus]AKU90233.1 Glucoamylase [Vulgatibacter incomptus]
MRRVSDLAISDYGMISDCRSAALVSRGGSIDWLCVPRFDSPSLFGRLLDGDAGHWSIRPEGEASSSRKYWKGALVLETTFRTSKGVLVLEDVMAIDLKSDHHTLRTDAPRAILRRLRCEDGEVPIAASFCPRPEFGLVTPLLRKAPGGIVGTGGSELFFLSSDVPCEVDRSVATGRFVLKRGERTSFALQWASSWEAAPGPLDQEEIDGLFDEAVESWLDWARQHQAYQGPWKDLVDRSGQILEGLTFRPTGAVIAAATTSLPERVGGVRNWDYRYSWIRDASLTLQALWVAACPTEAHRYFEFLAGSALSQIGDGAQMQIMYGVGGEHDLSEREVPRLSGWRGSRPVRVGNAAWNQLQLDVYGEILGAAWILRDQHDVLNPLNRQFLVRAVDAAASRWKERDNGIWELRGEPRHFLYSKLMCWSALDRGVAMAEAIGAEDQVPRWERVREEIGAAILEEGWSEKAGAFTQSFGSDALDASTLRIPSVGLLPASDPRMRSTIEAIATHLVDRRGLVYRYRAEDGLPGDEGTFLLCTFWLAQAWALAGQLDRAREVFELAAGYVNDLGLLAEEVDPETEELLGNFPQAFSHIGLINAAWAISSLEKAQREGRPMVVPDWT